MGDAGKISAGGSENDAAFDITSGAFVDALQCCFKGSKRRRAWSGRVFLM